MQSGGETVIFNVPHLPLSQVQGHRASSLHQTGVLVSDDPLDELDQLLAQLGLGDGGKKVVEIDEILQNSKREMWQYGSRSKIGVERWTVSEGAKRDEAGIIIALNSRLRTVGSRNQLLFGTHQDKGIISLQPCLAQAVDISFHVSGMLEWDLFSNFIGGHPGHKKKHLLELGCRLLHPAQLAITRSQ
jgi:hypothetical protein